MPPTPAPSTPTDPDSDPTTDPTPDPTSDPTTDPISPVSLVTGATRGIGREVSRQLASLGHTVVLTGRSLEAAAHVAGEVTEETGHDVRALRLDVTDEDSIAAAAAQVARRYGRLDVLVNNAGIHYDTWQRAVTADLAIVREAAETNLYGPWRMAIAFAPLLRASAHPRLVNVSSEAGSLAGMGGGTPAYAASKAGLNALTRMLADELSADGVLVNAVCPGWVATDMGGPGGRPVAEGAASVVYAATLPDDGPTGGFFRDGHPLPW
ncbi:SDR family oxidoreductase [Streptomyces chattanoogensis]|uniref:SDR family oxidoreductase n=1 Tax=Streptomyces chattanoogensis TaxID=66876 RepID=UPI0036A1F436